MEYIYGIYVEYMNGIYIYIYIFIYRCPDSTRQAPKGTDFLPVASSCAIQVLNGLADVHPVE